MILERVACVSSPPGVKLLLRLFNRSPLLQTIKNRWKDLGALFLSSKLLKFYQNVCVFFFLVETKKVLLPFKIQTF